MALLALLGKRDVYRARRAEKRLVKVDVETESHVIAAPRSIWIRRPARPAAAEEILKAAKTTAAVSAEKIAESREDVVHAHAASTIAAAGAALKRLMSELVVALALLGVVKDVVGLGRLLELLLGRLVAWIAVGVVLHRKLAVGGLYLVRRRSLGNSKHLVIISFIRHT